MSRTDTAVRVISASPDRGIRRGDRPTRLAVDAERQACGLDCWASRVPLGTIYDAFCT